MVTIIIRNDRFRIFMTDNINEQQTGADMEDGKKHPLRSNGITNNGRQCRVRCTLPQHLYNRQEGINCKKTESGE